MEHCQSSCAGCAAKSAPFTTLIEAELASLDQKKVEVIYRAGETIAKQGHHATHVFYLREGLVKIYKEVNRKENLVLSLFPKGSFIGLPTLFTSETMPYSVAAVEDSVICSIDRHRIESVILQNGQFASEIIRCLNQCNLYHFDKIVSLTRKQMSGKVAEMLLFLSNTLYRSDRFRVSLTRRDMAEFTGLSVMSVIRGLNDFKASGYIRDEGGWIEILEKEALEKVCQMG